MIKTITSRRKKLMMLRENWLESNLRGALVVKSLKPNFRLCINWCLLNNKFRRLIQGAQTNLQMKARTQVEVQFWRESHLNLLFCKFPIKWLRITTNLRIQCSVLPTAIRWRAWMAWIKIWISRILSIISRIITIIVSPQWEKHCKGTNKFKKVSKWASSNKTTGQESLRLFKIKRCKGQDPSRLSEMITKMEVE